MSLSTCHLYCASLVIHHHAAALCQYYWLSIKHVHLSPSSLLSLFILFTTYLDHFFLSLSVYVVIIRTRLVSRLLLKYLYSTFILFDMKLLLLSLVREHLDLFSTFFTLRGRNRWGQKIVPVVSGKLLLRIIRSVTQTLRDYAEVMPWVGVLIVWTLFL